jgi:LPPG:FO 2-phospho-L-lactate transferase
VDAASLSPEVSEALAQADAILFGPSNPWLSIAPILSVPGMREALTARNVPRVAVTPIVDGQAIKGPAAKLMAELGYQVSPHTVADYYGNVINGFVYDKRDAALDLKGVRATTLDTVMQTEQDRARLALEVLNWLESW